MKKIEKLTPEDIKAMSYNEIIGLVRETNRTPGGLNTIKTVARMLNLNSSSKILDIGTSTGHTALEFGRLLNCEVTGIDINDESIKTATERCKRFKLDKVKFQLDDATNLSFKDGIFDVVFAGNVTSLVNNREAALNEYWRVLKPNGYLVAVPMYYIKEPSKKLVDDVRKAIQVNIEVQHKQEWRDFFLRENDEMFEEVDFKFLKCSDKEIDEFCKNILEREHLKKLSKESMETLRKCYYDFMHLFNENNSHMGFTVFIIRRKEEDVFNDPELYHSERV
jgi:ubiquinone/menaquinone biosynthesis C-methylase UbiE